MYEKWFGTYSENNYNYVQDNMKGSYEETNEPHVYNFLPPSMCKDTWLTHVNIVLRGKKQHVINLCPMFFSPTLKASDRAVTLVRAMIQDSASTQDKRIKGFDCFSAMKCKDLARSTPHLAIEAPQSYALFAYDVYLTTKGTSPPHNTRKISASISPVHALYRILHLLSLQ